jgi:hypothetical protein
MVASLRYLFVRLFPDLWLVLPCLIHLAAETEPRAAHMNEYRISSLRLSELENIRP